MNRAPDLCLVCLRSVCFRPVLNQKHLGITIESAKGQEQLDYAKQSHTSRLCIQLIWMALQTYSTHTHTHTEAVTSLLNEISGLCLCYMVRGRFHFTGKKNLPPGNLPAKTSPIYFPCFMFPPKLSSPLQYPA